MPSACLWEAELCPLRIQGGAKSVCMETQYITILEYTLFLVLTTVNQLLPHPVQFQVLTFRTCAVTFFGSRVFAEVVEWRCSEP